MEMFSVRLYSHGKRVFVFLTFEQWSVVDGHTTQPPTDRACHSIHVPNEIIIGWHILVHILYDLFAICLLKSRLFYALCSIFAVGLHRAVVAKKQANKRANSSGTVFAEAKTTSKW